MSDRSEMKQLMLECFRDCEVIRAFSEHILEEVVTLVLKFQEEKIEKLETELKQKDAEIDALKLQVDEIEQYSRKYCLNVKGNSESENEDPVKIITELAAKVGVPVDKSDIDIVHRIGKKPREGRPKNATRDIIVKFANFSKRKELWAARKRVTEATVPDRRVTRQGPTLAVYITENLTKYRAGIMYLARELKRKKKIWAAWTDEGTMKIRKTATSQTLIVHSVDELNKVVTQNE